MDAASYMEQTIVIEHQMLTRCQNAAQDLVTKFQVWHGDDGGTIIECYRIDPHRSVSITEPLKEEKVFVIHRYKYGSPFNDDR